MKIGTRDQKKAPLIPDYDLIRRIGEGAYGEVWLARSQATGVLRAAKIVWRRTFEHDRPFQREFEGIQRFERISREHASQLALFHIGRNEAEEYFYYLMELADPVESIASATTELQERRISDNGTWASDENTWFEDLYRPHTLRAELAGGRLTAARVLEIGLALSEALGHLHKNGLVHRDVKPSNVIFVNGRPKLADIGLVSNASDTCSIVGTEGYLPPEGPGTPQADLFALGKVLFEAATGLDRRKLPDLPHELRSWPDAGVVFELNEIVLKACEVDVRMRYKNSEEMHADLALVQAGQSVKAHRGWERRWARTKRLAFVAGMLALSFAVVQQLSVWRQAVPLTQKPRAQSDEAQRLYELARWHFNRMTDDGFQKALQTLDQVNRLDPKFAPAYSLKFEIYTWTFSLSRHEIAARSKEIAEKLAAIGGWPGEVHAARGWSEYCEFKWEESKKELRLAMKFSPDSAMAHALYALVLTTEGNFEEARRWFDRALKLDPTSRMIHVVAGFPDLYSRNYNAAIVQFKRALELEPTSSYAHYFIGFSQLASRDYPAAISTFQELDLLAGDDPVNVMKYYDSCRAALKEKGEVGYWQNVFETRYAKDPQAAPDDLAYVYVHLGQKEKALDCLEKAFDSLAYTAFWMNLDPNWDALREEPRFKAMLRRAGFEK